MSSKLIWFAVAAVLGIGLAIALRPAEPPPALETAITATAIPRPAQPAALPPTPAAAAAPSQPAVQPLRMLASFNASQSYRTLIYQALKKPAADWYHYAFQAWNFCEEAERAPEKAAPAQARADALAALRQRCDMSAAERASAQAQLGSLLGTEFANDPVMKASASWLLHTTAKEEREALAVILNTADPMVISNLTLPSRARQDGKDEIGTYFLGKYHDSGLQSTFDYAFRLALCELGLDCGAGAPQTLLLCINQGWCGASYGDALRLGMNGTPGRYVQVQALAAQIAAQLRGKNVAAFAERT